MSRDAIETFQNFIAGAWEDHAETMPGINPATGRQIARLPRSDRACANRAVAAARTAQATWAARSVFERAAMCVAIASKIDEARPRIARTLSMEQGKPLAQATGEVAKAADGFRLASELVRQMGGETLPAEDPSKLVMTLRQPRGVYAVITPWNYPVNIPVEYLAPGIATGNTIVWVPAPTTSMVAAELMRAIESAGLPEGVINLVMGERPTVGDEIVAHPDVNGIGFTGSAATGQRIAERGAGKPMLLELGGNGPVLVFEDADLDRAAWHMIGTCRMGQEAGSSVVNKWNQSWDVPNLFIVDGSVLTTGSVVNPTPTISALALRAAGSIRDNFDRLTGTSRSMAA